MKNGVRYTLGVLGNEPILKPQDLKIDMAWAKGCDVDEIFIFRLGGINKDYKLILEDFIDNSGKVSFMNEKDI